MERFIANVAVGTAGGIVTALFGGWDTLLKVLLIFMALDYATGLGVAIIKRRLNSSTGLKGILKKASMLAVIVLAAQLDRVTGQQGNLCRSVACMFYISNEGISILENVGEMGVPLPAFIKNTLEKLKKQDRE